MIDKETNKETFLRTLQSIDEDRQTVSICDWLESSDFFEAPASTKYHLSEVGGLCLHSLNVLTRLQQINESMELGLSADSMIICALLHDLCKANFYATEKRNRKVDGKWEQYDAYMVDDKFPIGHGEKSVIILQKYIVLNAEEVLAIRWHMGAFGIGYQEGMALRAANEMNKLVFALQMADQCASYWDEKE
jgi:HD superfamily phosphohydrolase YqeK